MYAYVEELARIIAAMNASEDYCRDIRYDGGPEAVAARRVRVSA